MSALFALGLLVLLLASGEIYGQTLPSNVAPPAPAPPAPAPPAPAPAPAPPQQLQPQQNLPQPQVPPLPLRPPQQLRQQVPQLQSLPKHTLNAKRVTQYRLVAKERAPNQTSVSTAAAAKT